MGWQCGPRLAAPLAARESVAAEPLQRLAEGLDCGGEDAERCLDVGAVREAHETQVVFLVQPRHEGHLAVGRGEDPTAVRPLPVHPARAEHGRARLSEDVAPPPQPGQRLLGGVGGQPRRGQFVHAPRARQGAVAPRQLRVRLREAQQRAHRYLLDAAAVREARRGWEGEPLDRARRAHAHVIDERAAWW